MDIVLIKWWNYSVSGNIYGWNYKKLYIIKMGEGSKHQVVTIFIIFDILFFSPQEINYPLTFILMQHKQAAIRSGIDLKAFKLCKNYLVL